MSSFLPTRDRAIRPTEARDVWRVSEHGKGHDALAGTRELCELGGYRATIAVVGHGIHLFFKTSAGLDFARGLCRQDRSRS